MIAKLLSSSLLPVLFPIISGVAILLRPVNENGDFIHDDSHFYVGAMTFISALLNFAAVYLTKSELFILCRITGDLNIAFKIDGISKLFMILLAVIWPLVTLYAFEYLHRRPPTGRFFAFFLATFGILNGVACAANFLTLYLFYELMTFMTLPLVMHSQQREAIRGTVKYLLYSLIGAALALGGFCFFHVYGVSTEFTAGGVLNLKELTQHDKDILLAVTFLTLLGFGAKAGLMPLHSWLPTAHPVAPTPASAVLSGLITKGGVIAMLRVIYFIAGAEFLRGTWVQKALIALSLLTIFTGSMMAYAEKHLKKRIAWSSVSQVSYVIFALMLLTPDGFVGALLQIAAHAMAKSCLFLSAGVVIYFTFQGANYHYADQLQGIGKELPITMSCFAVASISLIGLPPSGGFVAKWFMGEGALGLGTLGYVGVAVLMISALLTAGYLLPIVADAFFPGEDYEYNDEASLTRLPVKMKLPLLLLSAGAILSGIFAGWLAKFFESIAAGIL
ncbi:MAG: hypothetical protein IJ576_08080 [Synergistaceae bacterium]|nr:hypothetical protein [Synergistaceae bacterium]MBR1602023.1 hypothetical protein [Synergistaceae bacterium]